VKITVNGESDMARALEGWSVPGSCEELILDAPDARRWTNCLLGSDVNCRIEVVPTALDEVSYAGLFSQCRLLGWQPIVDMSNCVNAAAMFKQNEAMRYSVYGFSNTRKVRDMRQCFWGCTNFSGNGLQSWDFSSLHTADSMRNFAGRTKFHTRYYDGIIQNLYEQAKAGTLPTPMNAVDFGDAQYSPDKATKRQFVIDYGWEIMDAGELPYELSELEQTLIASVDDRLESLAFPGDIDLRPVVRTARNGILISPRHVLYVKHYQPRPGQTISFWNGETAVIEKSVPGDWDIAVASLRDPVSIRPALVFPSNWQEIMPTMAGPPSQYPAGTRPPMVWFNQRNEIGIADLSYAKSYPPTCQATISTDPLRDDWFRGIAVGDSGSPFCCVYGDRLVVAFSLVSSSGSGVFTGSVREWLNEVTQGLVQSV